MASEALGLGEKAGDAELARMMEEMGLCENDLDDVIFEEDRPPVDELPRWLAVSKVHTETPNSQS
jgi:hypothetical protein